MRKRSVAAALTATAAAIVAVSTLAAGPASAAGPAGSGTRVGGTPAASTKTPKGAAGTRVAGAAASSKTPVGATALSAQSYDSAILADSPRFYWPLNETSGAVKDLTGHAAASTVTTAKLGVAGVAGSTAASFDGSAQRVQVPYTSSMKLASSFTVEVWAKLPSAPQTSGWPTLFSRGGVAAGRFGSAVWVSSDSAHRVAFKRNGADVTTSRGLTSTGYRHLAFTWDNTAKRWTWYVDGSQDTSGVLAALSGTDAETGPMVLGAMLSGGTGSVTNPGKVDLDGLAVYGSALSATKIAGHYDAGRVESAAVATRHVGGVAVGALQPWNDRRAADYQAMGAANSTWIRSDLGWNYLEPIRGDWRWSLFDPVVADATANGMRYLAILHTVPGWANGNAGDYGLPSDLSLLTNYCYQAAKHYIPRGVTEYEIGNEVNLPHPGWNYSGATYARSYLTPCVNGLRRAATETGANVTIVFGSVAPTDWTGGTDPVTFLRDAYAAGAKGLFDAVGWHPYSGADLPRASRNFNDLSGGLYEEMVAQGEGSKKIWATEFGMPTGGDGSVSDAVQSDYVNSAFDTWYAKPFAGPLFWYSARDTGTSTTDREQHFGVLRPDGTKKPAYATLQSRLTR